MKKTMKMSQSQKVLGIRANMKKFALLLLLAGCRYFPPPDYTSAAGVEYRFEFNTPKWDVSQIELQEQAFIEKISSYPGYTHDDVIRSLGRAYVWVYPSKFGCIASPTGYCSGEQDGLNLDIADLGCPGKSAVTHEMAHWLQQDIYGITDYNHTDKAFWAIADSAADGSCSE